MKATILTLTRNKDTQGLPTSIVAEVLLENGQSMNIGISGLDLALSKLEQLELVKTKVRVAVLAQPTIESIDQEFDV